MNVSQQRPHGLLVVGSLAFDSIETPSGKADRVLGGSVNYFSVGASLFTPVSVVGVVGDDFPEEHLAFMRTRGIDTSGVQRVHGKTFYWKGQYATNLDEAKTLTTELNVFKDFHPRLSGEQLTARHVFLANIDPLLQAGVLDQLQKPELVALDTMNFWLQGPKKTEVLDVLKRVDVLSVNEMEAGLLSGQTNLVLAAEAIQRLGPKAVFIKRGQIGSALFFEKDVFLLPAFPVRLAKDPTGAGDTFAAGVMGYLTRQGLSRDDLSGTKGLHELKQAMVRGTVLASFTVEDFGLRRLSTLTLSDLENRIAEFTRMVRF